MSHEKPDIQLLFSKCEKFLRAGPDGGANNFSLENTGDVPTLFKTFVAFFPGDLDNESELAALSTAPNVVATDLYMSVLELQLPDRVKEMEIVDDEGLSGRMERRSRLNMTPTIMVAFGATVSDKKPATCLVSTWGYSPARALETIQDRVRQRFDRIAQQN